jgi:hypothetical protein
MDVNGWYVAVPRPWALPDPLPPMEATVVGELFRASTMSGAPTKERWKLLNPQARSDLGFDEFLYQVRGCYPPASSQYETLFSRLIKLACDCPEDVYRAAFFEQLGELLGPEFQWAVFPKTKSLSGSGSSKPWSNYRPAPSHDSTNGSVPFGHLVL